LPATQDDPSQRKPDIAVAKREIGWSPVVTVESGLAKTIEYFQQVLDEGGEIVPTGPAAAKPKTVGVL
jgi:UDP-glucuronate decarboxylase|tara:strand:- start:223 stop:426 length:204 start_codon:yes stop_codon:yes gene_type:complete